MLKTTILSLVFDANEMLAINKVDNVKGDNKLIEKYRKLLKAKKLSKS